MMNKFTIIAFFIFLTFVNGYVVAEKNSENDSHDLLKETDKKLFTVRIHSKLEPITINNIHAWIVHVVDQDQNDVLEAEIQVDGSMPAHDHGLPTSPQVTKNLGDGCYLLEGMKFHMHGYWVVNFSITEGNKSDTVTFELNL